MRRQLFEARLCRSEPPTSGRGGAGGGGGGSAVSPGTGRGCVRLGRGVDETGPGLRPGPCVEGREGAGGPPGTNVSVQTEARRRFSADLWSETVRCRNVPMPGPGSSGLKGGAHSGFRL